MNEHKLNLCRRGLWLLRIFCVFTVAIIAFLIPGFFGAFKALGSILKNPAFWTLTALGLILADAAVFWVGMLIVYLNSVQLGLKIRIAGILVGMIPILQVIMLGKIMRTVSKEVKVETAKNKLNEKRKAQQICKTKYPILLVHGVFFRDFKNFNYWGRIPQELEKNGASVFYGNHNSAAAIDNSAKELEKRILEIVEQTGCEKVNVIAHSKGGLDTRTAISETSAGKYIASLTTVNTPHRGCEFADYLLTKIPVKQQQQIARTYNTAAAKLGDVNPDFMAAVTDLTFAACRERNERIIDSPDVYYQSIGSRLESPVAGRFPLNMTYPLVSLFDGPNDGLVGYSSFPWGENYSFLEPKGKRGISHGDVIDLNRENFDGFDVREFFVQLVYDLKKRGF